ncbi:P-loop containing nucleoside triphosphate hydrolase [Glarea lozoyensis ATCC 20868]|uniref:p-loop containing nucleoside triphosphate hydrolase n=1 Tax=Glarea lozoyensis (strain ATCC 20868 / MF5171) TaxID=1116229 RepID=S3EBF6_GLAL2|nr:P-loop containing nucleoside triphosphate hydrolase [Glarea lozoyensis ATCC 20868]EPE35643.1 P-loop containing nucleoside triphosphate hydrolase [Glarea lozoyensis ATCC 20868]
MASASQSQHAPEEAPDHASAEPPYTINSEEVSAPNRSKTTEKVAISVSQRSSVDNSHPGTSASMISGTIQAASNSTIDSMHASINTANEDRSDLGSDEIGDSKIDDPLSDDEPDASYDAKSYQEDYEKSRKNLLSSFVDFTRATDERIIALENFASRIDRYSSGSESDDDVASNDYVDSESPENGKEKKRLRWPDIILTVKFYDAHWELSSQGLPVSTTMTRESSFSTFGGPRYIVKVLYNPSPGYPQTTSREHRRNDQHAPSKEEIDIVAIKIASEPVISLLETEFGNIAYDRSTKNFVATFTKPFRPLLRQLKLLKDHIARVEDGIRFPPTGSSSETPSFADNVVTQESNKLSKNDDDFTTDASRTVSRGPHVGLSVSLSEELEHFRIVVTFIECYFDKQINLHKRIRAGKEDKVAFENLWMLFEAGDTVFAPSTGGESIYNTYDASGNRREATSQQAAGRPSGPPMSQELHVSVPRDVPQGYRVSAEAGGIPLRKALAPHGSLTMDEYNNEEIASNKSRRTHEVLADQSDARSRATYTPLCVYCFYIDYNGERYGTVSEVFIFKQFDEEMEIRSLDICPLFYLDDRMKSLSCDPHSTPQAIRIPNYHSNMLEGRGKKFMTATRVSHMNYDGLTVGKSREEINTAVIVDFKLAFKQYWKSFENGAPKFSPTIPFWYYLEGGKAIEISPACIDCLRKGICDNLIHNRDLFLFHQYNQLKTIESKLRDFFDGLAPSKLDQNNAADKIATFMEKHDLVKLLPGVAPAFALRHRKWVMLDLSLLSPVELEDGWKDLVLPKGHREMVQAMVETHAKGSKFDLAQPQGKLAMDLVRGKGRGCIILLHGAPGVGKTSTAECVAAYTQRPLYPITCGKNSTPEGLKRRLTVAGDIGYLPEQVEMNMEKHFKLAHEWGCVLLLDEADVFLAKRNKEDVKRNGLVSVFLRILEYYSGILFLTTNRVGAIDDAFRSRLHLTLYYPKLSKKQALKIWETNLNRMISINEERVVNGLPPVEFNHDKIIKWVKKNHHLLQWNGRQIRNAFQTAVALGEFKAKDKAKDGETPIPVMDIKHFKIIGKASMEFNQYLLATHGFTEDKAAAREQLRAHDAAENMQKAKTEAAQRAVFDSEEDSDSSSSSEEDVSQDDGASGSESDSSDSQKEKKKKSKDKKKKKKNDKGKGKLGKKF